MDSGLRIGRVLGIEIRAAFSWFIVFVLVTWSLAAELFPSTHPGWSTSVTWAVAAITSLLFFASILAHELGHSVVARSRGIDVQSITLFIFGGIAQIKSEPEVADDELVVALAGPAVTAVLAAVFWSLGILLSNVMPAAGSVGIWLGRINATVLVFNLVPGFPLDGGRVFRALVWKYTHNLRRATRYAATGGQVFAYVLIFWGLLRVFQGGLVDGIWLAFIGWFLQQAAVSSRQQIELRELMKDYHVRDLMDVDCPRLAPDITLEELVYDHVLARTQRSFVVVEDHRILGIVTMHHIKDVDKSAWGDTTVDEVMIPLDELKHVDPDTELVKAFGMLTDVSQLPVVQEGRLVGILSREHVMEFLRVRSELDLT